MNKVMNCKHCGEPCASIDPEDEEALMDGSTALYAIHISCEREMFMKRNRRARARAVPRKPKVSIADIAEAFAKAEAES